MTVPAQIATEVCARMAERKLTQTQVAARARLSQSQVSRIRAGQFKRVSRNVGRICAVLDVNVGTMAKEEDLVALVRRIVRKKPTRIGALARALDAMIELAD